MMNKCPICDRIIIPGPSSDGHHLVPKTFKGREVIHLHKICHRKIHSVFSERDLFNYYHTIERIINHEEIKKFIKWVQKKDPEFYDNNKDTKERKRKRRR